MIKATVRFTIYTFSAKTVTGTLTPTITVVGRARLVGFEERDRDCCFHSVTVRVDMPTFKTDCNIKICDKSKEAAE